MGAVKWGRPGEEKLRGQETLHKCFFWGPRYRFPDSPCSFLKLKLGSKTKVFYPHWMVCQRREFLSSARYFRLRIHIFCQAHLADFLPLRYDWKERKPRMLNKPLVNQGLSASTPRCTGAEVVILSTCAVPYSFQVRSFSVQPLQRGRNH